MALNSDTDKHKMPYIGELEDQPHSDDDDAEDSDLDLDPQDDGTWEDWVEEDDEQQTRRPTQSLFDAKKILDGPEEALIHDKENYGVDILDIVARLSLDFHQIVRLLNYIRATHPPPEEIKNLSQNALFLQDDTFLTPTIPDDPLLQLDIEELAAAQVPSTSSAHPTSSTYALQQQIAALQQQLAASQSAVREQKAFLEKEFQKRFLSSSTSQDVDEREKAIVEKGKKRDDDTHYFNSYSQNEIHEIMLKDSVRTNAYRDFITSNSPSSTNIFKDKIVLDVGCGTGILSMFCARAGARKVYGVDASDIAYKAMKNVRENGLDETVKIVKGKLEDLPDEEFDKVDIIVSEWMGYFLLYEAMLDSVLYARDRFLKPGGLMVPSQCSILFAAISDASFVSSSLDFWNDVYGFKMSCMKSDIGKEAEILVLKPESVVSSVTSLKDVFMQKDRSIKDADFKSDFVIQVEREGETTIHGFLGWFDTFFTKDGRDIPSLSLQSPSSSNLEKGEIAFTTGPSGTPTHWKQTFFLLNEYIPNVAKGTTIKGSFTCRKAKGNSRELEVEIVFRVGAEKRERIQAWTIA